MDVASWLAELGLAQYAQAFAQNHVDTELLSQLTDADLRELGVASWGHRKRLLAAVALLAVPSAPLADARAGSDAPASDAPSGERRQVTVLFADLVGFTALSQTLDPEELREVVGRYTQLVGRVVVEFGGVVDKHIGDAVMALFGAPRAHDDDPLRAARAALEIHEALARLGETDARPLRAHIGIASGEVLAGLLARAETQDYTVLGDAVNLAARLVSTAGAGETVISDNVYRALSGRGRCDDLGLKPFKGIDGAVRIWSLRSIASDAEHVPRSLFVGREAELAQFAGMLDVCVSRRTGQVVFVRGQAGIGKSRLIGEMQRLARERGVAIHRALVLDFGVGKGRDPIGALLRSLLDLAPDADPEARLAAVQRASREGAMNVEQSVFLHDLLDLPLPGEWRALYDAMSNAVRNRGKRAVMAALAESACRRGPTMFVVEDLHWADPQLLDQLSAMAAAVAQAPGLLALTARAEGDPLDAAWRTACQAPIATIDLGPLRLDEARRLAEGFVDASQRLALACIDRADGNPLFLEQLLRHAEEGSDEAIPASIQSLVLARMDRLTPQDRYALQAASVIGQRFDLVLLRRLLGQSDYACDELLRHALVLPEGEGFLFAHALIQEAAYTSLLKARRRELHAMAAESFAAHDPVLHAQHLDRAQDARAANAYMEAALTQRSDGQLDAALRLVERGLEVAPDADRHGLLCCLGELQRDLGDIKASIATYRAALDAATDEVAACQARIGLAEGLRVSEGLEEALELLDAAQAAAERRELVVELARLHHLRGNILFPLGKIDGCRGEHERSLAYAQRLASPEAQARALGGLADAAYAQARMRTAFGHFSRCVELSREHGLGRIEVANRSMMGFSRFYLNEVRQAREDGIAAARAAVMVGQPRAELLGEVMGVHACFELGAFDEMQQHMERESRLVHQLGAHRFEAQALEMRARFGLYRGQRAEAERLLREALAICRRTGMLFVGPRVLSALSRVVESAVERDALLREGEELLRQGAVGHSPLGFYRDAIEAMLDAGDGPAACRYADSLEAFVRDEALPWSTLFVARGRALARTREAPDDVGARNALARVREQLEQSGLRAFLPPVEAALA